MRRRIRTLLVVSCWAVGGAGLRSAAAADPGRVRSDPYYWWHGGVIAGELLGTLAVHALSGEHAGRWDLAPFAPDDQVRNNFSNAAAMASDRLRLLSLALPMAAQLSNGFDVAFAHAGLVYTEVQTSNLLLTALVKEIVRRPRPYTHSRSGEVRRFAAAQGSEAYASFFSGHSSASHAAAMSGSLLYAARTREPWARHFMWGSEFLLAGITAQLRVRAGRHYRTDVWFGSLVGAGIGVALPALHGVPLSRVRWSEVAVGAGAVLLSNVGAELLDVCAVLNLLGACPQASGPGEAAAPLASREGGLEWSLLPAALPAGVGLQGLGRW